MLPERRAHVPIAKGDALTAFHVAGHAVVAANFGIRFHALMLVTESGLETEHTGPLGMDLWRAAYPDGQPERVLQVVTALWAGSAAERQVMERRIAPTDDRDRPTIERFVELAHERGRDVPDMLVRRGRLNAYALMRLPHVWAAVEAMASRLLEEKIIGFFTARRLIQDALRAGARPAAQRGW